MNNRMSILHFVTSVLILIITLLFMGLRAENSDMNAASMYLLVYGFLVPVCWGISFIAIRLLLPFFAKRKFSFAAFIAPSVIFAISIAALGKGSDDIVWALMIVSTLVNLIFYFIYTNKEASV